MEEAVLVRREKRLSRQRGQQVRVPEAENGLADVRNTRRPEAGDGKAGRVREASRAREPQKGVWLLFWCGGQPHEVFVLFF